MTGDNLMTKTASKILIILAVIAMAFASSCATPKAPFDSNWKLDSVRVDGTTTLAADIKLVEQTRIIIDSENNVTFYYDGKIHYGRIDIKQYEDSIVTLNDTDMKLYCRISGQDLRVSIDNSDENVAVFNATKEETLIPVVEEEGTYDISVTGTGNMTVEFTNRGDETWCFGEYYNLEVKRDDIWFYVPSKEPVAVHDLGHELAPGQSDTLDYDLDPYGKIRPGDYRLAVGGIGDRTNNYYVYFTVEEDGSKSFS